MNIRFREIAIEEEKLVIDCRDWLNEGPLEELTPAQIKILGLLRNDPSLVNKELADKLNVTVRTVKFHMTNLLAKFGSTSRHEMLRKIGKKWELYT